MTHLSQLQLQDFVLGTAGPTEEEVVREHVSHCPTCAVRLRREARFDLLIQDAVGAWEVASVPRADTRRWSYAWRPAWVSAVFLTMAVGLWLYLSRYQAMPITAQDTYAPPDYCLFIGGQVGRVGLQTEFPDSASNRADVRR